MKPTVPREQCTDTNGEASVYELVAELNEEELANLQSKVEMRKRDELFNKHPYKIWKGKDELWYTYFPDVEKGRVRKKRKTEKEIRDLVIEYWKNQSDNPTVEEVYREWVQNRVDLGAISPQTKERYDRQYTQCFGNFGKRRIKNIDAFSIEEFVLKAIHDEQLTRHGYNNLRTIIYGMFRRAKKMNYIGFNIKEVVQDIDFSRNSFRKTIKTEQELVFSKNEIVKVTEYIIKKSPDIISLGILLLFKTGLRPGELVALEWCDIGEDSIYVHRTEVRDKNIYYVRDFPKSDAGIRDVVIPESAKWIIERLRELNPSGQYVFERHGKRLREYNFSQRFETICKHTGVVKKSLNKIRKTYATILLDSNVNDSIVLSQMGHRSISTTMKYYYKDRTDFDQKVETINSVVGL